MLSKKKYQEEMELEEELKNKLKSNKDFFKLINLYSSLDKGSVIDLGENMCKVAYFSGRLQSMEYIKKFADSKGAIINMIPFEYRELSELLLRIGIVYPNVSEEDLQLLEKYYTKKIYVDFLNDIFFDSSLLPRKINKFDNSLLKKKNSDFSPQLISDILEGGIFNYKINDYNNDEIYYYDKSENNVKAILWENHNPGIHFMIEFPETFEEFSNVIDAVLGDKIRIDFYKLHMKDIQPNVDYENIRKDSFSLYYYDLFLIYLKNQDVIKTVSKDDLFNFNELLVLQWLEKINQ